MVHDFIESLNKANSQDEHPLWLETFKQAFVDLQDYHNHVHNGDHQKAGIDCTLVLSNSRTIRIDKKIRFRNKNDVVYTDIFLEIWSDKHRGVPGWVQKPLLCDYIAYAIGPLGICYLLPVIQLQLAFVNRGDHWIKKYGTRDVPNTDSRTGNTWISVGVPVKPEVLYPAIGAGLRAKFAPVESSDYY